MKTTDYPSVLIFVHETKAKKVEIELKQNFVEINCNETFRLSPEDLWALLHRLPTYGYREVSSAGVKWIYKKV